MADDGLIVGGQGTDEDRRAAAQALSGNFPASSAWADAQRFYPNFPINPAGWDAFLEHTPESLNIEDRRGLPDFTPQRAAKQFVDALPQTDNGVTSPFESAASNLNLTPQERALYQRHLTNLYGSGGVDNPDGSRSTLYQMSFERDGKVYNIPTVWGGQIFKPDDAIKRAEQEGLENFPSYTSQEEAEQRYNQMHSYMERDTQEFLARRSQPPQPVRFEPVEHDPFNLKLVPVEHDPFAAPGVTPVGLMRPTPNAPVMTPDERLRWNEQEMQRELQRPDKGEEELNKTIPPRPREQWASATPGHFANVRYNNPGAMYPGSAARRFGSTGTGTIGGGHLIADFPTPVHGAAANMENVTTGGYVGMPIGSAIFKWSGGGRNSVPGYDPRQVITSEMARDPNFMIPFMQAVAGGEAPGRYPMSEEQWRQAFDWYMAGGSSGEPAKPFDIANAGGRPRLVPVDHNPFAVSAPQPTAAPTNTQGLATALFNRYAPQRALSLAQYMPEGARQYYVE